MTAGAGRTAKYDSHSEKDALGGADPDGHDDVVSEQDVNLGASGASAGTGAGGLRSDDDFDGQRSTAEQSRSGTDDGGATTPVLCKTPSEPGSPHRPFGPRGVMAMYHQTMADIWEWKPEAPEFVPGFVGCCGGCGMSPPGDGLSAHYVAVGHFAPGATGADDCQSMGCGGANDPHGSQAEGDGAAWAMQGCGPWTAAFLPMAVVGPDSAQGQAPSAASTAEAPAGHGGCNGCCASSGADSDAPLREQLAWQVRRQEDEINEMQRRLSELESKRAEVRQNWDREREALMREVARYRDVLERYAIPLEEACERVVAPFAGHREQLLSQPSCGYVGATDNANVGSGSDMGLAGCAAGLGALGNASTFATVSSLDSKMQRLNGLLEGPRRRAKESSAADAAGATGEAARDQADEAPAAEAAAGGEDEDFLEPDAIAGTLREMFPHAVVRTQQVDEEVDEVSERAAKLERRTQSEIDDRARKALLSLPTSCALEALQKVDDLVESQGGRCRNLSSILQSICRKLERRTAASSARSGAGGSLDDRPNEAASGSREGAKGGASAAAGSGAAEFWTAARVESAAASGFELLRAGSADGACGLRISMRGTSPPLTEAAVERYCDWLRTRLGEVRQQRGQASLHHCCAEVDFSNNGLGNQEVWLLLATLAQYQVHTAVLNLDGNRISQAGVLALCEFIRSNCLAGPLHEMHLANNDIDDESALELLSTLHQLSPKYPPKRRCEEAEEPVTVPVWIHMSHNTVRDSAKILKELQAEGIDYCCGNSADGCGPTRCSRSDCPLLHLPAFSEQSVGGGSSHGSAPVLAETLAAGSMPKGAAENDGSEDGEGTADRSDRKRSRGGRKRHRDRERRRGGGGAAAAVAEDAVAEED